MPPISDQTARANLHRCTCRNDGDSTLPIMHDVTCQYAVWYYETQDTPADRRRQPVPAIVDTARDVEACSCHERIGDNSQCPVHGR